MSPPSHINAIANLKLLNFGADTTNKFRAFKLPNASHTSDQYFHKIILLRSSRYRNELLHRHSDLDDVLCSYLGNIDSNVADTLLMAREETRVGNTFAEMAADFLSSKRVRLRDIATCIHHELGFPVNHLRQCNAHTQATQGDVPLLYPPPDQIERLVIDLETGLRKLGTENAELAAIIVNAAMVHCHMFIDGNHRTGRAMYNAFFPRTDNKIPVPITLLSSLYRESYLLKMRRVIIFADWDPMLLFVQAAHDAVISIQETCDFAGSPTKCQTGRVDDSTLARRIGYDQP